MILCCLPIQCIGTLFSFHTDQAAFQSFSVTKHLQIDPVYKQFAFRLRKCINNGNGIGVVCRLLFHRKLFHIRRKNQLLRKAQPEGKAPCLKCFFHKNSSFFLCNLPFSTHRVTIPFSAFMIAKKRCSVNCLLLLCNVTCNFLLPFLSFFSLTFPLFSLIITYNDNCNCTSARFSYFTGLTAEMVFARKGTALCKRRF